MTFYTLIYTLPAFALLIGLADALRIMKGGR